MSTIEIPLNIPNVKVVKVEKVENRELLIFVESTVKNTCCRECGKNITKSNGSGRMLRLRHLAAFGLEVYICIRPVRYQCIDCDNNPTTTQTLPWYNQRSPHTKVYENHVLMELINSTVEDVSIRESLGYEAVMGIIERHIKPEVNWQDIERIDTIGIDEISLKKGHKDFVVIVTALTDGKITVLAVLKDRKKVTVKDFFLSIPKRLRKSVEAICTDMYDGFVNAAKEVFGRKIVVVDRFHVAKLYRKGLETLRKKELKRLKEELSEDEYKKLKGVMWLLRKSKADFTEEETATLKYLFELSPSLEFAYDLCKQLTDIFDEEISKGKARLKIEKWKKKVKKSGLTCFNPFLKTLDNWMEEITNYFIDRQSSGFVEGLNNKIKVIKRRCYGILNVKHLFQRLYLDVEGYALFA